MRVVIAPDSLKGSATAAEASRAIEEGWRSIRPDDDLVIAPMADGGEGTVDAVAAAIPNAEVRRSPVAGPASPADARDIEATWLLLPPSKHGSRTALIELAEASGLLLLKAPAPLTAHTLGFGQLIAEALAAGADRLLLAIGGSCSTDGGAGALRALGAALLDADATPVPLGNAGLLSLATADLSGMVPLPPGGAIVLSDVDNPLLGGRGAVAVFGPQKGIDATLAPDAERALEGLVGSLATSLGPVAATLASTAGAGAAGGTGFGMLAWGASVTSGARAIAETIGLPAAIAGADLVITGEGRFDGQSAGGKAPVEVARLAASAGVPCALVAGSIDAPTVGFVAARALADLAGSAAAAIAHPLPTLRRAGALLAQSHG